MQIRGPPSVEVQAHGLASCRRQDQVLLVTCKCGVELRFACDGDDLSVLRAIRIGLSDVGHLRAKEEFRLVSSRVY